MKNFLKFTISKTTLKTSILCMVSVVMLSQHSVFGVTVDELTPIRRSRPLYVNCSAGKLAETVEATPDPVSSSLKDLATQMLANSNITYWTNNGVNTRDVVVALSEGKRAYTTYNSSLPLAEREVDLNPNILQFIIEVAKNDKIMVNALTDKGHSANSNHYKGKAVDLDNDESYTSAPATTLDSIATKYGGVRNNEDTHWHYDFTGAPQPATPEPTSPGGEAGQCCPIAEAGEFLTNNTGTQNLKEFVDKYGQIAFDVGKQYGIPYEAILGQASIESANGKSQLTQEAFNFFGIKAGSAWLEAGNPVWISETKEENPDGGEYTVTAEFRAYPNAEAGFRGYGEFITTNSRYSNALNYPGDPVQYISELKAAGYATDTSYVNTVVTATNQVSAYIQQAGLFPPSSSVEHDATPPNQGATTSNAAQQCGSTAQDTTGSSPEQNKATAKQLLAERGFNAEKVASEFACLDPIWTQESGWNQYAINDAEDNNDTNKNGLLDMNAGESISETEHDAYGIPQSLPGGKMAANGSDWRTNPVTQMKWGLDYITERYGDACAAKVHKDATGWY